MKAVLAVALTVFSVNAFAGDLLRCVNELDTKDVLEIDQIKPGQGGAEVVLSYMAQDSLHRPIKVSFALQWQSSTDQIGNKSVAQYSNNSDGKKKHDIRNVLHDLNLVWAYDLENDNKLISIEATLTRALVYEQPNRPELSLAVSTSNYTCKNINPCFDKEYKRISKERAAVGAVMTAEIEQDILNECSEGSN